jgi:hypothetical protein
LFFGFEAFGDPMSDGFDFIFYQHFYEVVHDYLMTLLNSFHSHYLNVARIHAMVCVISKKKETDYSDV